jgi:hypothetical protein
MASGGDGYPVFISRAVTRDIMDQVLADYVAANTPISPAIQGRIECVGASCPVVTPWLRRYVFGKSIWIKKIECRNRGGVWFCPCPPLFDHEISSFNL